MKTFVGAVLAGICVSLGGTVFLRLKDTFPGSNVVGALLFTVGLFTIVVKGYHLYTGKICYVFDNPPKYLLFCFTVWLGNFTGAVCVGILERCTAIRGIGAVAEVMVRGKMEQSALSLVLLGLLCNIFIYIAVNIYVKCPHDTGKYLALFLGVSSFILCGTEHSVADMYYWVVSGAFFADPLESLKCLLLITAGNALGGVLFPLLEKIQDCNCVK